MSVYELSNRQHKHLHERAGAVLLFLPAPPGVDDESTDLKRWAGKQIPEVAGNIASAYMAEAVVTPGGNHPLGQLLRSWSDDRPCWCAMVVAVKLEPLKIRSKPIGPQWPQVIPRDNDEASNGDEDEETAEDRDSGKTSKPQA